MKSPYNEHLFSSSDNSNSFGELSDWSDDECARSLDGVFFDPSDVISISSVSSFSSEMLEYHPNFCVTNYFPALGSCFCLF